MKCLALTLTLVSCGRREATELPVESPLALLASSAPSEREPEPMSPSVAEPAPPVTPGAAWPPEPPGAVSDFCIEGIEALDESSCYVLPDAPTSELVIYLHGIVPPEKTSRQKTNFEKVVSAASRRAGVAALMPRGRVGLALRGHERWWGWPTSGATHARWAPELVRELGEKRTKLEQLVGKPFERVYLAGSSSGAYFVIALALSGELPADGYAAISGATDRHDADLRSLRKVPFYIGFGTRDTVGGAARSLYGRLKAAGFSVALGVHPLPHGTAEVYLDEAFSHFREAR